MNWVTEVELFGCYGPRVLSAIAGSEVGAPSLGLPAEERYTEYTLTDQALLLQKVHPGCTQQLSPSVSRRKQNRQHQSWLVPASLQKTMLPHA